MFFCCFERLMSPEKKKQFKGGVCLGSDSINVAFSVMLEIISDLLLFYIKANCHANTLQISPIVMSRWEACVNSCANLQGNTHAHREPHTNVF